MKAIILCCTILYSATIPDFNGYFWYTQAGEFVYENLSDCNGYMPWEDGYTKGCDAS